MSSDNTLPAIAEQPSTQVVTTSTASKIKAATPDIIIFDDLAYPSIVMEKLLFENISSQELLSVARHDNIVGKFVSNSVISNAAEIASRYNSSNILYVPDSIINYFKNFSLNLISYIPIGDGATVSSSSNGPNVYFDYETNSVVLEFKDLSSDDQVEVEIVTQADMFNGTIYAEDTQAIFSI